MYHPCSLLGTALIVLVGACASHPAEGVSASDQPSLDRRGTNPAEPPAKPPGADDTAAPATSCLRDGEEAVDLSARFPSEAEQPRCCLGLQRLPVYDAWALSQHRCVLSKADRIVCSSCGDGRCGVGENHCNCSDCR